MTTGQPDLVCPRSAALEGDQVSLIAAALARTAVPWELHTGEQPQERCYERLVANDQYEAWLIYWPPRSQLDLHDHGDSIGAFSVVAGQVEERVLVHGAMTASRVGVGRTVGFGLRHVHAISNPGASPATSVHVYSPPLRSMGFYDASEEGDLLAVGVTTTDTDWLADALR